MGRGRVFAGLLVIAICAVVLLVASYHAIARFEQTHIAVPLILTAVICAAIIFGILKAMKGSR